MTRTFSKTLLQILPAAALAAAGCTPPEQGSIFIQGVQPLTAPACSATANATTFASLSVLDIGEDPEDANDLVVPVTVVTNLPATFSTQTATQDQTRSPNYPYYGAADNNVITFTEAEVFFSTDADRDGEAALTEEGLPTSDANARATSIGGTVFNTQTTLNAKSVVFVTAITTEDAALLQKDEFVSEALGGDFSKRVVINANIRVNGVTTGGATVRSPPFPYQVELCQGCLTTALEEQDCDPVTPGQQPPTAAEVCNYGQDYPALECQTAGP